MNGIVQKISWTQKILQLFPRDYNQPHAAIAQMVERIHGKDEVSGSIPDGGSISELNPFLLEVRFTHFSGSIPDGGFRKSLFINLNIC